MSDVVNNAWGAPLLPVSNKVNEPLTEAGFVQLLQEAHMMPRHKSTGGIRDDFTVRYEDNTSQEAWVKSAQVEARLGRISQDLSDIMAGNAARDLGISCDPFEKGRDGKFLHGDDPLLMIPVDKGGDCVETRPQSGVPDCRHVVVAKGSAI